MQAERRACTFTFGSADDSGAGKMGFYYAREFQIKGWEVSAICPKTELDAVNIADALRHIGVEVEIGVTFGRSLAPSTVNKVMKHLRRHNSNLLVSMHQIDMKFAGLAGLRTGISYIASGQNTLTFSGGCIKKFFGKEMLGLILRKSCSEVVATSRRVEQDFRKQLGFKGEISVLPNGVDTNRYRQASSERNTVRAKLGYTQNAKVFVSVGRITPQKNQLGLVDAFAKAFPRSSEFHLLLIGGVTQASTATSDELDYFRSVQGRISELGIANRILITGWSQDVPNLLAAADIYVQSSLWEGSPLAVIEAMASGLPIIVADNGGVLPEFRTDVHGWIIPNNDTAALVEALRRAGSLQQTELHALGLSAQELACKNYDISIIANQFFQIAKRHAVK